MELLLVQYIFLWLLQVTGDLLMSLVPIVIGLATPFVTQWATSVLIKIVPSLKSWGVLVLLVPVAAGAVTLLTNLLTTTGPVWYWQLILGLLAVLVNEVWKAFKTANEEPMGLGARRLAAKRRL